MNINELITHFQSVKQIGSDHYQALCPCHNDHKPSLDIALKGDKILMSCPVCNANGRDVMQAVGIDIKELFLNPYSNSTMQKRPKGTDYIYADNLKKSRFYIWDKQKQEYKKAFCWYHKDKQTEKWQKGLPTDNDGRSISPPLYKQSVLAEATDGRTVYIVEGEKDVDTMTDKLHLTAVCSPHGAGISKDLGKKWRKEYNELFKGLNVSVIADNDNAGSQLAKYIANEIKPYAQSVKIIDLTAEWENLKPKGDITDIYESETPHKGRSIAEAVSFKLEALTDCTPLYEAESNEKIQSKEEKSNIIYAPVWAYESDRGQWKIDEPIYITEFVKEKKVRCINGTLYSVDGAIEDSKAKQIILREILPYHKTNHGDKARKLLDGIKAYCYTEPPKPSLDKIHFKNGTLSRDENGLFTVWSNEKEFCINRIECNYNPTADEPEQFFEYLNAVYNADDIKTLQQYCGYCLIPTTAIQQALIIIGDGGEGKSVLGAILNGVMGESNCFNESIGTLQERFGVANIENKLLFIDDDLSENALKNARMFKNLVTNKTTISAERKNQQKNEIKSYVRFICFGNFTLQSLYDTSKGFSRRQLVLQSKPKDENRVDNPFIDKQIIENEAEGVMKWLVQGLNELIANGFKLYVSDRTKEVSDKLKRESNTVQLFLDECDEIIIETSESCPTIVLFDTYKSYCENNGLIPLKNAKSFTPALKTSGKTLKIIKNDNVIFNGKRFRGFNGISVKNIEHYFI
ncbi:MAG: phage/plasmid primase, P4 family [Ruminococcus sp.]|nr:phage/plasmid primase, P4 family [Ruminococcus sp.]